MDTGSADKVEVADFPDYGLFPVGGSEDMAQSDGVASGGKGVVGGLGSLLVRALVANKFTPLRAEDAELESAGVAREEDIFLFDDDRVGAGQFPGLPGGVLVVGQMGLDFDVASHGEKVGIFGAEVIGETTSLSRWPTEWAIIIGRLECNWQVSILLPLQFPVVIGVASRGADGHEESARLTKFLEELGAEGVGFFAEGRDPDQVVAFVGVGLEVVEAIDVPVTMGVDVFPAVSTNGKSGGLGGKVPLPVVFVENVVAPWGWRLESLEEGEERAPVEFGGIGRSLGSGSLEEGGSNINVLDHFLDHGAWLDARPAGEKRDPDAFLEGIALVVEAVFAESEPVVSHVNHKRVLGEFALVEVGEKASDVFIEAVDGLAEVIVEFVEVRDRVVVEGAGLHVINPVDTIAAFADPAGLGSVVLLGIGHGGGVGDFFALVTSGMAGGGGERVVDSLIAEVEEEGLIGGSLLEPLDGLVGQDVRIVALEGLPFAVDVKLRIKVGALSLEADPVVEPGTWFVVVVAHVPLTNVGGAVTGFLEVLREEDGSLGDGALVVDHPVVVHILAGEDGGPARGTEGGADEGVGEVSPFFGESVKGRGFQPLGGILVEAHEVVAMVVAENEDNVGWIGGGKGWEEGGGEEPGEEGVHGGKMVICLSGASAELSFWA